MHLLWRIVAITDFLNSHLLGKKSWNVYNHENIERVKRDEAQATAREEEDERRMQEVDAERRIQALRGESPSTPPPPPPPPSQSVSDSHQRSEWKIADSAGQYRKRRRLAGEDDTDRDIRLAQEDATHARAARDRLAFTSNRDGKDAEAPLVDSAGHINLFPESGNTKAEKNAEAEAEVAKKKRSYEDQYTMRFSNAAGFKEKMDRQPWYSSAGQDVVAPDSMPEKDVWGNEDPRRKEREKARIDSNDPLAAMKRGVRQLRATEQERKRWNEEKRKELEALKSEERHRSRHHPRRRPRSADSLEGFSLDAPTAENRDEREYRSSGRRHRHHRQDRSRDRSHRRSHRSSDHSRRRRDSTHGDDGRPQQPERSSAHEKR